MERLNFLKFCSLVGHYRMNKPIKFHTSISNTLWVICIYVICGSRICVSLWSLHTCTIHSQWENCHFYCVPCSDFWRCTLTVMPTSPILSYLVRFYQSNTIIRFYPSKIRFSDIFVLYVIYTVNQRGKAEYAIYDNVILPHSLRVRNTKYNAWQCIHKSYTLLYILVIRSVR